MKYWEEICQYIDHLVVFVCRENPFYHPFILFTLIIWFFFYFTFLWLHLLRLFTIPNPYNIGTQLIINQITYTILLQQLFFFFHLFLLFQCAMPCPSIICVNVHLLTSARSQIITCFKRNRKQQQQQQNYKMKTEKTFSDVWLLFQLVEVY